MTDVGATTAEAGADGGSDGELNGEFDRYLLGSRGFKPGDDRRRVAAYEHRWRIPLDLLAMCTIWLVVVPPSVATSDHALYDVLLALRLCLSAVYALDIVVRSRLAPHHWYYFTHNPLAVASVVIPFFRVLFSLQLLRSIFRRGKVARFALAAGLLFANLTTVVYLFERHAPHGNIKTIGNALWWAVVTLTTVGYGDFVPVTWQGRVAAAALMFVGFAVLATITAQISSSFIDQAARARAAQATATAPVAGAPVPDPAIAERDRSLQAIAERDRSLQAIAERLEGIEARLERLPPPS